MRTRVEGAPASSGSAPIPTPVTYSAAVRAATIPVMLAIGGLVSIQSKINGELAQELGTGLRAAALSAVISFGGGLILLAIFVLCHPASRRGVARLYRGVGRGDLPGWLIFGGLAGALFVASQGIAVGSLGVALFIVAFVAGQSTAGLMVDHFGIGPGNPRRVSRGRMIGAALAVIAVAVSAIGSQASAAITLVGLLLALLPLVAGMGTSVQQGMNGRVAVYAGSWATTFNNFLIGLIGLLIYFGISMLLPGELVGLPQQWWLYVGGLLGIGFIWASSILVRIHGVLILGLCVIAGQVITAVVIDLITARQELTPFSYVAAAVTLVGVGVATLLRPRPA